MTIMMQVGFQEKTGISHNNPTRRITPKTHNQRVFVENLSTPQLYCCVAVLLDRVKRIYRVVMR
jgi:hypothetical protein